MDTRQALKIGINSAQFVSEGYLNDLTDADLLVRAVPGSNHIAWQLGHLIAAEHDMINLVKPGSMPKLPDGFREKHEKATATSDDPKAFLTKAEYLELARSQRAATLAALDKTVDAQFDEPAPEALRNFVPTVGAVFAMQGSHWMMHAGQWALIRRKLGRPPLF